MKASALFFIAALAPACAFASSYDWTGGNDWKGGQFEVGGIYGYADSKLGNLQSYGGYVAAGKYFGNHLVQLQFSGVTSEDLYRESGIGFTNPVTPSQTFDYKQTSRDLQEYPIWFKYAYGISFGPNDCIRVEAGPLLGLRIISMFTKYDTTVHESGQPDKVYQGSSERDGGLTFDYGLSAALRVRFTEHWGLVASYQYVRSSKLSFESEIRPLGNSSSTVINYAYFPISYPEHGTHYASMGLEYRF